MKKYERATPIGIWTGKVMIGGHYLPKPKQMTEHELVIQGLLRGHGLRRERAIADTWRKVKSIVKNVTCTLTGENRK